MYLQLLNFLKCKTRTTYHVLQTKFSEHYGVLLFHCLGGKKHRAQLPPGLHIKGKVKAHYMTEKPEPFLSFLVINVHIHWLTGFLPLMQINFREKVSPDE